MKRALVVIVTLCGIVGSTVWLGCRRDDSATLDTDSSELETPAGDEVAGEPEAWAVDLYFPGGEMLRPERHELPASDQLSDQAVGLINALLSGPRGEDLNAPLAADIKVRKVYVIEEERAAYLDLESPEGSPPPASGSTREMLTVYSLVNTVVLNIPEIDALVLLWNSQQLRTFAGHVDTARPLLARNDLIATPRE